MTRSDRSLEALRPIQFIPNISGYAEGSCLVEMGRTKVITTVTVDDKVPAFLKGQNKGWLTAEYAMLPRATNTRTQRDIVAGKIAPRSSEIQRLIARSLRNALDLSLLGQLQFIVDCDVIEADGGTRTASINGAYVALAIAVKNLMNRRQIRTNPLRCQLGAVSVGLMDEDILLDPNFAEDSKLDVDANFVMNDKGLFVEIQSTAENRAMSQNQFTRMMEVARQGIETIFTLQKQAIK